MTLYNTPAPPESEDCLYLNVYAPASECPEEGRAVLFWIYGGNLQFGYAGLPAYDGSSFAANQDVIVVTTNYRTNVLGFSNSPQIPVGQQNSGFLDQRKALEWVQQNIAAFGGNPNAVTIFGESAGGYSVKQLLANPPCPLTFSGAIMESEATVFTGNGLTNWETLVADLGCTAATSQIDCVRAAPATQIKDIIETKMLDFAPVADNITSTNDVRPSIASGRFAHVPFFLGTNSQEGNVLAYAAGFESTNLTAAEALAAQLPGQPAFQAAVMAAYPTYITESPYRLIAQFLTDFIFLCPAQLLSSTASTAGYDVWRYYYNASFPDLQVFPNAGAYHSSEIAQVFGSYYLSPGNNQFGSVTTDQVLLSRYMQTAWANFAKDPCAGPGWPSVRTGQEQDLLDVSPYAKTIPESMTDAICALYDPILQATGF